jgi:hypothetical protein
VRFTNRVEARVGNRVEARVGNRVETSVWCGAYDRLYQDRAWGVGDRVEAREREAVMQ